jgi:hypothetical protein
MSARLTAGRRRLKCCTRKVLDEWKADKASGTPATWTIVGRFMPERRSTLTCPECAVRTTAVMPTDACQYFYDCPACGAVLKPLKGDCCVFCSYGDVPCPPIQQAQTSEKDGCCARS